MNVNIARIDWGQHIKVQHSKTTCNVQLALHRTAKQLHDSCHGGTAERGNSQAITEHETAYTSTQVENMLDMGLYTSTKVKSKKI